VTATPTATPTPTPTPTPMSTSTVIATPTPTPYVNQNGFDSVQLRPYACAALASLNNFAGTESYCYDCLAGSNPCSYYGYGAFADREGVPAQWDCDN
jgi:hypothetical protein